ncbi:MAG TPA: acyl-CoA dehydrogenase family protein [Pseudonocardia sp.]|nr:acyl-CoA dehydrogenase family protein [Pseudonocardia sp.]
MTDPKPDADPGTEDREALRQAVAALLDRTPPGAAWPKLCGEIGVAALAVPERYGGAGAGLPEVCVVLEELGRTLTPAPMLGSAVLAATAVLNCGDESTRERLLPGIAAGTSTAALAWAGARGRWDPAAPACRWDGRLHGEAHYVLDGADADVLVVAARTAGGVRLFEVDPADSARIPATPLDDTRPLATVLLVGCPGRPLDAAADTGADQTAALAHLRDVACVALAAEQVGTAAHCLAATVAYTKQRVQFGRPIAHFQALQHRLADLHVLVETARSAVWAAARAAAAEADKTQLPLLAGVAKVHCSEVARRAAAEMVQMHGGIAITWEHVAHRYLKRAHGGAQLFGQPHEHVARLAEAALTPVDPS